MEGAIQPMHWRWAGDTSSLFKSPIKEELDRGRAIPHHIPLLLLPVCDRYLRLIPIMMPDSLSIETEVQSVCTSPLDVVTSSSVDVLSITSQEPIPSPEGNLEDVELASPLHKAIRSAMTLNLDDEESSSTDTAVSVSSPIFDSCSDKGSSDGSVTEDEKEPQKDEIPTVPQAEGKSTNEEPVEPTTTPRRPLNTKRSLWNLIRGASVSIAAPPAATINATGVTDANPSEASKQEAKVEAPLPKQQQSLESASSSLNKRRSFATFPSLNWSKTNRRHTLTATNGGDASETNTVGAERSLDGSLHLPTRNVDEAKVAEDAMRFADARHLIKIEQDIEVIRQLAERLEQGWREKQHELATMRHHLEESQLHLHDIRDENKHLRSQLASMSEQIVARDNDFEELQKVAVEQSKKERAIWEIEKMQAVLEVEEQVKELQEELAIVKEKAARRHHSHSVLDESDEESDYRDAVLFSATTSATTSIDDEMQYQQSNLDAPFTTPTTPTTHNWHGQLSALRADPLTERLSALQARHVVA
jgi:hypothetical protein